jgi:hypothetical protein
MDYLPPPDFKSIDCGLVECCVCGAKCVLYWLKDEVWKSCQARADCCGGHLCLLHAEEALGRPLTLRDIDIENYLLTARNMRAGDQRITHCIVDLAIGAANFSNVELPKEWCMMWKEYYEIGMKLCEQTDDAAEATRSLIAKTELHFPKFSNPYDRFVN